MKGGPGLRAAAHGIIEAALAAVDPVALVASAWERGAVAVAPGREPHVVAVGKAALGMASGAAAALGGNLRGGLVVCPEDAPGRAPSGFTVLRGGHPLPTAGSVEAARRVVESLRRVEVGRPVVALLSGGASSLLALPAEGLALDDLRATTVALQRAGAPIEDVNAVRKHLDTVKGGGLARATASPVFGLVLSDVVGDRLDVIGSGPFSPDPTTYAAALAIVRRAEVVHGVPERVRRHLERGAAGELPETLEPGEALAATVELEVVGGPATAARAAVVEAMAAGFAASRVPDALAGEARAAGRALGAEVRALAVRRAGERLCLVAAGETVVTVRGGGRGGRNQELALAAALEIEGVEDVLVATCATDGRDGPTEVAGAWVDGTTVSRARRRGLDPSRALATNDSHSFFAALGDHIVTGPTGTNVADLAFALVG